MDTSLNYNRYRVIWIIDQITIIKITGMKIEIRPTTRPESYVFPLEKHWNSILFFFWTKLKFNTPNHQSSVVLAPKGPLLTKKNGQGVARAREHKLQGRSTIMSHPIETLGFRLPQFSEVPSFNFSSILFTTLLILYPSQFVGLSRNLKKLVN